MKEPAATIEYNCNQFDENFGALVQEDLTIDVDVDVDRDRDRDSVVS